MQSITFLLFLLSIASLAAEPFVILALGQSNMSRDTEKHGRAQFMEKPNPLVKILNSSSGEFEVWNITASPANSQLSNASGSGVIPYYFARRVAEETGDEVRVIASARGGKPISYWDDGQAGWNNLEKQASYVKKIDLVLWQQGESDSARVGSGLPSEEKRNVRAEARVKYFQTFGSLTLRIKEKFGKVKWITGEARPQHNDVINSVFKEFAKKAPTMFAVAECSNRPRRDTQHFSDEAICLIGYEDYWRAWLKFSE